MVVSCADPVPTERSNRPSRDFVGTPLSLIGLASCACRSSNYICLFQSITFSTPKPLQISRTSGTLVSMIVLPHCIPCNAIRLAFSLFLSRCVVVKSKGAHHVQTAHLCTAQSLTHYQNPNSTIDDAQNVGLYPTINSDQQLSRSQAIRPVTDHRQSSRRLAPGQCLSQPLSRPLYHLPALSR
jgi:hypothetical protein